MRIIKTKKYKKAQTWSSPDAQDASIDMPEPGVGGDELMSWVDEITTGGPYVGTYSALKEWLENAGEEVDDKYPRDPTEMENKTFALVQRIEQIAKKRGSMASSQIEQDEHEAKYEDYHEGLRKDRNMGLASSKLKIKTAQEDGYYYSQIYTTIQEIEKDFPQELKKMQVHVRNIGDLEAEIINLSKQGEETEGQDYYGSDYISQTLAGDKFVQILRNDELESQSIWDINGILQGYTKALQRILRDLKWDMRDQNDPNTPQDKWLFRG